ncbi:TonB-dependent receptor domain-containing protein [Parahaliea mediterranea]|uniref:TonB-dependent receptor n=1 Tax=Parahaliea mediterranea TaxID=651086 RepID=A0A939DJR9_9GAMM|nr:TonB-dependent receptor [Parahaliea mediterranea]MBN7798787.1 TonB-dependent receptor [Parahaliea mediterranea]
MSRRSQSPLAGMFRSGVLAGLLAVGAAPPASAQSPVHDFNIPSGSLSRALLAFSAQADVTLMAPDQLVDGKSVSALRGEMSSDQALEELLRGSGLQYRREPDGGLVIFAPAARASGDARRAPAAEASARSAALRQRIAIEEVVVTAQKREQSIRDVPISVAALGGTELQQRRITDFSDLSMAVPSLSIPERGGAGDRFIFLRGMGSIQGSTPLVGIYLDEASVTTFPGASLNLQTYDMARVEVLRGPQGTLYGVGSMGGTIKFITEEPRLDEVGGRFDASASTTQGGDPSYRLNGVVNMPLVRDEMALRVVGTYVNDGGWIDQPALDRDNIDDEELAEVRARLRWLATERLELNAMAIVHRGDSGAPSTGEDADGNYTQAYLDPTTPSGGHDYELYNLTLDYDLDSAHLLSTTSYVDAERRQREIGYRVPFGLDEASLFHAKFDEDSISQSFTQELRLSSAGAGPWNWLVGAFYRDAELDSTFEDFKFGPPGEPFFFDVLTNVQTQSWAVFGETSYSFNDRLEIGVGLRYFEDRQEASDFVAGTEDEATFDSVSPRLFVSYDLNDEIKIYASASEGFRSGGLAGGIGVRPFEPDTVWSYELGSKMALLQGRMNADVAVFYSDYKDTQVDSINLVGEDLRQFTSNAGDAEIQGIDWELSVLATANLSLGLGGEVIDTEFVEINAVSASHAVGDPLDFIPDYHVSLWGQYDTELFGWSDSYIRVDYTQKGPSRYGNRTICSCYESYSGTINMLNAIVGLGAEDWSIKLFAKNILNDRGYVDAESIEQIAARARPRTIGVEIGMSF